MEYNDGEILLPPPLPPKQHKIIPITTTITSTRTTTVLNTGLHISKIHINHSNVEDDHGGEEEGEEKLLTTKNSIQPSAATCIRISVNGINHHHHHHHQQQENNTVLEKHQEPPQQYSDDYIVDNDMVLMAKNIQQFVEENKTPQTTTTTTFISTNNNNNNNNTNNSSNNQRPYFFYNTFNVMSSGQVSPSDTLDSGTCSDLEVSSTVNNNMQKVVSTPVSSDNNNNSSVVEEVCSDSGDDSCGKNSLNSSNNDVQKLLLQTYDERSVALENSVKSLGNNEKSRDSSFDNGYKFYMNEKDDSSSDSNGNVLEELGGENDSSSESFAGFRDVLGGDLGGKPSTIRSSKGTVRGVRNRVRAGIVTFEHDKSTDKVFLEKEAGKVVVYTTTMGVLRDTYQRCMMVKQILRTLLVKFEERDVFMSPEYQMEIRERMKCDQILVPQVFVDGQHVGDAETIERLNESHELRRILKPFKCLDVCSTCKKCGGFRMLPCRMCNGSKKSVHRNDFTAEFVALKCMNCNDGGLVRCNFCS